jgi:hypothetical protein
MTVGKTQMNESVKGSCLYFVFFLRKREMLSRAEGKNACLFKEHIFTPVCGSKHCYSNVRVAESGDVNRDQPKGNRSATP